MFVYNWTLMWHGSGVRTYRYDVWATQNAAIHHTSHHFFQNTSPRANPNLILYLNESSLFYLSLQLITSVRQRAKGRIAERVEEFLKGVRFWLIVFTVRTMQPPAAESARSPQQQNQRGDCCSPQTVPLVARRLERGSNAGAK